MLRVLKSNLVNLVTYVWRKLNRSGRSCLELKTLPRSGYIPPMPCQKLFSISQSVLHIYDVEKRNDIPKVIAFLFCIHKNTNQQHESSLEEMLQPPPNVTSLLEWKGEDNRCKVRSEKCTRVQYRSTWKDENRFVEETLFTPAALILFFFFFKENNFVCFSFHHLSSCQSNIINKFSPNSNVLSSCQIQRRKWWNNWFSVRRLRKKWQK